jgi:glutaryl-CoA dehydrogenase
MAFKGVDFFRLDDLLSKEEKLVRGSVREYLSKEVEPYVAEAFHGEQPLDIRALAPQMGDLGMLGAFLPTEYGCPGANYVEFGLICQEVERVDSALRSFVAVTTGLVMYPVWRFGSEEQRKYWLPKLASGEAIGCYGLTEPNHGSDPGSMESTAEWDGSQWILNGSKTWITEADIADMAVVFAKDTSDGKIKGFIVEARTKGFTQSSLDRKGSMRAGGVGELGMVNCPVPEENRLPDALGLKAPFSCLNQARYGISWGCLGAAMDCYDTALTYCRQRKQFGEPLASFQLVQDKLVHMFMEIGKGQLVSHRVGRVLDEGRAIPEQISFAKKNNVSVARMCARTSRELLGANGVSLDYSPIRHMANIESVYTYEGTNDIHTLILGRHITGMQAFKK